MPPPYRSIHANEALVFKPPPYDPTNLRPDRLYMKVIEPFTEDEDIRVLTLYPDEPFEIGRSSQTLAKKLVPEYDTAWFNSKIMSRNHATLFAPHGLPGPVEITDYSKHGVFVNGMRIPFKLPYKLPPGAILKFGEALDDQPCIAVQVDYTDKVPTTASRFDTKPLSPAEASSSSPQSLGSGRCFSVPYSDYSASIPDSDSCVSGETSSSHLLDDYDRDSFDDSNVDDELEMDDFDDDEYDDEALLKSSVIYDPVVECAIANKASAAESSPITHTQHLDGIESHKDEDYGKPLGYTWGPFESGGMDVANLESLLDSRRPWELSPVATQAHGLHWPPPRPCMAHPSTTNFLDKIDKDRTDVAQRVSTLLARLDSECAAMPSTTAAKGPQSSTPSGREAFVPPLLPDFHYDHTNPVAAWGHSKESQDVHSHENSLDKNRIIVLQGTKRIAEDKPAVPEKRPKVLSGSALPGASSANAIDLEACTVAAQAKEAQKVPPQQDEWTSAKPLSMDTASPASPSMPTNEVKDTHNHTQSAIAQGGGRKQQGVTGLNITVNDGDQKLRDLFSRLEQQPPRMIDKKAQPFTTAGPAPQQHEAHVSDLGQQNPEFTAQLEQLPPVSTSDVFVSDTVHADQVTGTNGARPSQQATRRVIKPKSVRALARPRTVSGYVKQAVTAGAYATVGGLATIAFLASPLADRLAGF